MAKAKTTTKSNTASPVDVVDTRLNQLLSLTTAVRTACLAGNDAPDSSELAGSLWALEDMIRETRDAWQRLQDEQRIDL